MKKNVRLNTRKSLFLMLTVLFMLALAACGGNDKDASSSNNANRSDDTNSSNPDEVIKLKMNTVNPPSFEGTPQTIGESVFADLVKEKTDGNVEIEIFYSNQLVGQAESLDALAKGTIDMQVVATSAWMDKLPESGWTSLMFGWDSPEALQTLMREEGIADIYAEGLNEYGVTPIHYYFSAASGFLSTKPISKTEDLKGLIVNSPSSLTSKFYESLGASTAAIPFAEYYEGLLRGTIDAVVFPYDALESMMLAEVADYVTTPGQIATVPILISMSTKTWEKLPEEYQEAILEAGLEAEEMSIEAAKEYTDLAIEFAVDEGVEVVELTDEDWTEFATHAKETTWSLLKETNERSKQIIEIIEENLE